MMDISRPVRWESKSEGRTVTGELWWTSRETSAERRTEVCLGRIWWLMLLVSLTGSRLS